MFILILIRMVQVPGDYVYPRRRPGKGEVVGGNYGGAELRRRVRYHTGHEKVAELPLPGRNSPVSGVVGNVHCQTLDGDHIGLGTVQNSMASPTFTTLSYHIPGPLRLRYCQCHMVREAQNFYSELFVALHSLLGLRVYQQGVVRSRPDTIQVTYRFEQVS
jgi:hypothetical protein